METICQDLEAEHQELDRLVSGLDDEQWNMAVPFEGWTVKDEISHLAYFDRAAALSATDVGAFTQNVEEMMEGVAGYDQVYEKTNAEGNAMAPARLLAWWRKERTRLVAAYAALDPKTRLPWYGPPMSARSSATARLMETWAHGQDIADALGVARAPTDRLRHIAHLGVRTFAWAFKNREMAVPDTRVRVELVSPSGQAWEWGPADAGERVAGPAADFCLVVAQRRHHKDTALEILGDHAMQWMEIAQAFAGEPSYGPQPGERVLQNLG